MDREAADAEQLAKTICDRVFRASASTGRAPWLDDPQSGRELVQPGSGYVAARETLSVVLGLEGARLFELGSLPQGRDGHRLVALRYFIENADVWLAHFAWPPRLVAELEGAGVGDPVAVARALAERVRAL
ncbi:MAG: hypothetical protein M3Y87_30040, partial [Myxococcota bacterium]|nr:hypothetical protein [Myxococcota bacterium]